MNINNTSVGLKVKLYSTKSSLDVQGLKSYFSKEIEALGNRTIAVYFVEVVIEAVFQCMMNECDLDQYNEYCKEQLNLGLASINNSKQQINKNGEGKIKKSKKQTPNDIKCSICESNTKELNSFQCQECSRMFHKLCVNKRTSPAEFALIKSGDVAFHCDDCICKRRGFSTQNFNSFNLLEAVKEIVNECVEIEDPNEPPSTLKAIEYQNKSSDAFNGQDAQNGVTKEGEIGEVVEIVDDNDIVESTEKESHCQNKCSSSKTDCESCVTLKQELLSLFDEKEHLRKEHEACKLEMEKWKEVAHKQEQANIENVNKLDSITKEKDALIIEIERRKEEEKIEEVKWQRANLDFDRMKVLHEKVSKENVKIAETCKSEIKEILKQKLEADNRYHDLVNEREKYREKERILLNTFDLWRSQIEINTKKVSESSSSPDITYECKKMCV